jgi:hypothetical protein
MTSKIIDLSTLDTLYEKITEQRTNYCLIYYPILRF